MGAEHEYKFAVAPDWELPPLGEALRAEPIAEIEQHATYYDTPDLRLARAGASLRFRDDDGWTVKLPIEGSEGGLLHRAEHRFGGEPGTPPSPALELVAARVRTARLTPVARLRTARRRTVLRSAPHPGAADGRELGVLTDDACTVVEGPVRTTFREVEVEVAPGAPLDALDGLVDTLRAAGAPEPDPTPKVVRALGRRATDPPDLQVHEVGTPPTVEAVIRHAFSDAVTKLVVNDPVVRIGEDIEGVHQARVATRRLRSHLRTFGPLLEPDWADALRDELGWLGDELGAVRDADVLRERLEQRVEDLDEPDRAAARPILDRLASDQAAARAVLLDGLRSARYLVLLDRLHDAAQRPRVVARLGGGGDDEEALLGLVRSPWRRLRRAVALLPEPAPDPALHAIRIRAKRTRYAAEVVEPAFGKPARDFAKAITRVQDVLGEHQDAVVAGRWLRATALTLDDPAAVYAAGELGAMERAAADASRAEWPAAWRGASKRSVREWL